MVTALFGVLFVGLMLLAAFTVCAREQPMRPAGSVIKSLDGSQQQFEYAPEIEGRTSSMQVVLAPQRFVYW